MEKKDFLRDLLTSSNLLRRYQQMLAQAPWPCFPWARSKRELKRQVFFTVQSSPKNVWPFKRPSFVHTRTSNPCMAKAGDRLNWGFFSLDPGSNKPSCLSNTQQILIHTGFCYELMVGGSNTRKGFESFSLPDSPISCQNSLRLSISESARYGLQMITFRSFRNATFITAEAS